MTFRKSLILFFALFSCITNSTAAGKEEFVFNCSEPNGVRFDVENGKVALDKDSMSRKIEVRLSARDNTGTVTFLPSAGRGTEYVANVIQLPNKTERLISFLEFDPAGDHVAIYSLTGDGVLFHTQHRINLGKPNTTTMYAYCKRKQ